MKSIWFIILFISGVLLYPQDINDKDKPYLSNLHATKESALYTTYAAAMERSEFVLDEGYQFHFYDPNKGIDFKTDTSGDLCLGFIVDGQWIYKEADMYRSPVITASYPDLVKYNYYPVKGVKVEAYFLVQSSRLALWDVNIINETDKGVKMEVVSFMRNDYRSFSKVKETSQNAFIFEHQSYPDNWTVSHKLPYQDTIKNIFIISDPPDRKMVFNSLANENVEIPYQIKLKGNSVFQLSGRAMKNKKERIIAKPQLARMQVYLNSDKTELLTENSPLFGLAQPSIDQQGYFRMELGNFEKIKNGDQYSFTFFEEGKNLVGSFNGIVNEIPKSKREDVFLKSYNLPAIPRHVMIKKKNGVYNLSWRTNDEDLIYDVYKREYPNGIYKKVANNLSTTYYKDYVKNQKEIYGYIVISKSPLTGEIGMHSREVNNLDVSSFDDFLTSKATSTDLSIKEFARVLAFKNEIELQPKETKNIRLIRLIGESDKSDMMLKDEAKILLIEDLEKYITANEQLFSKIPKINFKDKEEEMLYWSSFNMMRQVFYPPEGKSSYNYYVFSREPTWGWGHGGQVFHESIAMLAYAYMDGQSAMDSQRVFSERQYDNGYINYRTGSYLDEIIDYKGQLTSSAPWYAWQNWEVYKITGDRTFLKEMYDSSKKFYNFYVSNRDSDNDGLCEWGGEAVLESVRDALVAVWDQVGWPANFEGVDVNSMLVNEAKALEAMANELGLKKEAEVWKNAFEARSLLINQTFWDKEKGFYFNVDKKDNNFTFKSDNDLKREEIIGFLPLWAGIASDEQAGKLVTKLKDPNKFWRKYGVPSLAADDPYYNDKGYWNGPVWIEWNFLIVQGLLRYGYYNEAKELVDRVAEGMIDQLKQNHNLWEFYSPDEKWAGYHKTYIWAGIINRMMIDVKNIRN